MGFFKKNFAACKAVVRTMQDMQDMEWQGVFLRTCSPALDRLASGFAKSIDELSDELCAATSPLQS